MALFLQHVINAVTLGSQFALYALGIALLFGIMGLINFAHGELIMVGGYTIVLMSSAPWPVVVLATIAVSVAFAIAFGVLAFSRRAGVLFLLAATLIGLSRIAVGLHYPSDSKGGETVARSW